ncbi:MAG: pyridoxamine 5'-phosphate oxidase family protein [Oscillospiraceae bacterium]|nr:pyridoxamine 5'-phosphate oxidase family protein [Oscillospiraceae bacterium]
MFRELNRKKQALSGENCIEVLRTQKRGVLCVNGDDGYPYAVPMNHWYCPSDGKIYFHGGKTGHKIDAMRRDAKVSFCVTDGGTPDPENWWLIFRSVIVFGRIEWIDSYEETLRISREICRNFPCDAAYIEHEIQVSGRGTLCFALVPEHISGKRVTER